jgi:hypothetical protein
LAIRSANVRLGALFFVLSAAITAQASQPSSTSWVALSKGNPAPASVTRKSTTANSLNIVFSIPGLEATDVSNNNGIHGRLSVPDSGHTSEIGKPELPVIRRLIVAPEGASLSLSWKAIPTHRSLTELGLRFTNLSRTNGNPHLKWLSADSLIQPPPPYIIWASTNLMSTNWLSITNIQDRTPPTNTIVIPPPFPSSPTFFRITIPN